MPRQGENLPYYISPHRDPRKGEGALSRFARKRSLATLRNAAVLLALVLTSWLVATTCFAALDLPDIAADASRYREQITGGRDTGEGVAVRLHAAKEAL